MVGYRLKTKTASFLAAVALLLMMSSIILTAGTLQETEQAKAERMAWWTEARFGMFIHWGLYAQAARHEWVKRYERLSDEDYQKYFEVFDPDLFNPQKWARAAKAAGMKYFVVTTKHHEGFCLWDSSFTDYKVTNTPYGKDLIQPLVQAFRDEGLRVGLYYSLLDWHHPEYPVDRCHPMYENSAFKKQTKDRDVRKYAEYCSNQVREILTGFGTIDCLFMDFSFPGQDGKGRDDWQSERLLKMIRRLQPQIILNDRLDLLDVPGGWDFRTPEQVMPREWVEMDGERVPWETCQTFSGSWGYHRDESSWKSVRQLVVMLIETVSKGGNLLLNVGPTARGTFDDRALARLQGIGDWMSLHNRSIYGCSQAPRDFPTPPNCLLTHNPKTNRLYVHVLEWPMGRLALDGFAGRVKYAQLLNDASEIKLLPSEASTESPDTEANKSLLLALPVPSPEVAVPVIELFLK